MQTRKTLVSALSAVFLLTVPALADSPDPAIVGTSAPVALGDNGDARTAVLQVQGVKCAGCSTRIRKVLKHLHGVLSVRSGASKKRLEVDYDASKVKPKQLAERVNEAGFKCSVVSVRKRGERT